MGCCCLCPFFSKTKNKSEKVFGFDNIGNSCYINSFLQIIIHCPNFLKQIKALDNNFLDYPLIKCIITLSKKNDKSCLKQLRELMGSIYSDYKTEKQCDSQEFGRRLITEIIKAIKEIKNINNNESFSSYSSECSVNKDTKIKYEKFNNKYGKNLINIEKMFLVNEITINLQKEICKIDSNYEIELYFPTNYKNEYSLYDLLDFKYSNEKVNNTTIKICNLPDILIISIIRSTIEHNLITSLLKYDEELNLEKYVDKKIIDKDVKNFEYKLFGINIKKGESNNNGHYYCYVYINKGWICINDTEILSEKCFSSKEVVGLFYRKK